jgi:hypothetical protein
VLRWSFSGVLLASTLAFSRAAGAQLLRDPFLIPADTVSCHDNGFVVQPPLQKPARWFDLLLEKEPNDRTVKIAFDSIGTPEFLELYQSTATASRSELIALAVAFAGDSVRGWRWRVTQGDSLAPQVTTKAGTKMGLYQRELLDRQSLREARRLANWLWGNRCGR